MKKNFPLWYYLVGYFLLLSVLILLIAGISLLMPETFWRRIWYFKREDYQQMLPNRIFIGGGFWLLAIVMAFAAIGWFKRSRWGWTLTILIFLVNGLSDAVRIAMGSYLEGIIGVCVTAVIIFYLMRPSTKKYFVDLSLP